MTLNDCVAVPPEPTASVAVSVTVVSPAASGVSVTVEPAGPREPAGPPVLAIATVATPGAEDEAAYVNGSPSGSRNAPDASTVAAPSAMRSVRAPARPPPPENGSPP